MGSDLACMGVGAAEKICKQLGMASAKAVATLARTVGQSPCIEVQVREVETEGSRKKILLQAGGTQVRQVVATAGIN